MKDFLTLAKERYSVRRYKDKPVEKEKLNAILEAGRIAPSACNCQPWIFLVIDTPDGIAKLTKGCNPFAAPLAIIVCADTDAAWVRGDNKNHGEIDAAIATDHMMLCAQDLGLSTCWICAFNAEIIRGEFHLPEHIVPVNILPIGYSADEVPRSPDRHAEARKPLESIVKYGAF